MSALAAQLFVGARPDPARLEPANAAPGNPWKPEGGIWTSTLCPGPTSAWIDWCRSENFGDPDGAEWWMLAPAPGARVYAVDSRADFARLLDRYGVDPLADLGDFRRKFDFNPWHDGTLDWPAFAGDHDGLRVTERALYDHGLRLQSMMLYRWDCESTWWARWCFGEMAPLSKPFAATIGEGR